MASQWLVLACVAVALVAIVGPMWWGGDGWQADGSAAAAAAGGGVQPIADAAMLERSLARSTRPAFVLLYVAT